MSASWIENRSSGHSPSVLIQVGQEIVLDGLSYAESARRVLFQTARDELLGIFGNSCLVGEVNILLDLYK